MVDVGLIQLIVKRMNRWYRRRSKPHGTLDPTYRGLRLSYNNSYRLLICIMSLFLLSIAGALFLVPSLFADQSPSFVLVLKICWTGLLGVVLLAPVQAFREFVIVNDEGLMKSNLFGRQSRLAWEEISLLHIKLDENEVIFLSDTKAKLKLSLCYNGWQDFLETSAKHLRQALQRQLESIFAESKKLEV